MKTVEFKRKVERHEGYTVEVENKYVQVKYNGRLVAGVVGQYSEKCMTVFTDLENTSDEMFDLVIEYAKTPIEDREEERKWVIPWGVDRDGDESAWWMSHGYGPHIVGLSVHDWRKDTAYHFTDSQIEEIKANQSPAIAKAIDIAKELVIDE